MESTAKYLKLVLITIFLIFSLKSSQAQLGWYLVQSGTQENIYSICFINPTTGFCTGYNGLLLKTTNEGINWTYVWIGTNYWLKCINFPNENTGYIIGNTGIIAKTINSGSNWSIYPAGTGGIQNSVFFINSETGYVSTSTGEFLKTTNGTVSWTSTHPVDGNIRSIYFFNPDTGLFSGQANLGGPDSRGIIFKTTNGGNYWDTVFFSTGLIVSSIQFTNSVTGYASCTYGLILKTTNSGTNWIMQSTGTSNHLYSLYFLNNLTGYSVGQNGTILKTVNGGDTWLIQQNLATNYSLTSVWFTDSLTGYSAGLYGTIIKTTTGGVPVGIPPKEKKLPVYFSLSQNYPNPFNPKSKIKFDIAKLADVKLIIYDVLGREIATLINEKLKAGTYEAEWDASNYPCGVYFYKLITEDYSETRKMVLVK